MRASKYLQLNGIDYDALFTTAGLKQLDDLFLNYLASNDLILQSQLLAYRQEEKLFSSSALSELLINCAYHLEMFIANLFGIADALAISQIKTLEQNPIAIFKKYYVLRRAKKEINRSEQLPPFAELNTWLTQALEVASLKSTDKELNIALLGNEYLSDVEANKDHIEKLVAWCTHALITPEAQSEVKDWVSFTIPARLDYQQLVPIKIHANKSLTAPEDNLRHRDGFKLTDPRMNMRQVQDEVNYCIYCHDHDGDFCSKGFPVKKGQPELGFKKNPLDVTLTGCPLDEKISEMNFLKQGGFTIAALTMVMIDNPMCPATGHRICNDCMKACIYQKQEPVNIPQIETRVLTDVLALPWGVEIYDLLTRWHPLRKSQPLMKAYNGLKVLIAGMGPAGFTLAHHLLLEGFAVVGFDGLKIEPLPPQLIKQPIYSYAELIEALDERIMAGFGGVAEYGITVRWDKNFLKLIYLSLMRKPYFQVFGGVRFGGTIEVADAWALGFDHFAVAVGAGLPKVLNIENSMAIGMRQANDFLMSLQLGSAAKSSSITNLQIRMPAVIIGGGLTGVDTATEVQAYYLTQIEKILTRYEHLSHVYGEEIILSQLNNGEREILSEFLRHAQEVRSEREKAQQEKRLANLIPLIHNWGGVSIAYRRSLQESPAYINNHEELQKALSEGIFYREGLEPIAVDVNEYGHAETLICHQRLRDNAGTWVATTQEIRLPARTILVATGTQPNTAYEFEHRGTFNRLNLQYQHYEDKEDGLHVAHGVAHCKDPAFGPFTSYQKHDKRVSLIGDTHPVFHGNVVKAIASGLRTYPKILSLFKKQLANVGDATEYEKFANKMRYLFETRVHDIKPLNKHTLQLDILAPLASKHFKPGQFYRLQNFESQAKYIKHTTLQMEPLALAAGQYQPNILTFLIHEKTATSKLCTLLKKDELVSLMGPTGVRAKVPHTGETILMLGQEQSLAFVRSYASALRQAGNKVFYIADFISSEALVWQEELEKVCDMIIWHTHNNPRITPTLSHHHSLAMQPQFLNSLSEFKDLPLADVDRLYVLGDANFLKNFQIVHQQYLKPLLLKNPKLIASVYGNMQCMLKGVCAQCWQWQIDPETGKRTKAVFACSWQDQPLEIIDLNHLQARNEQNSLHEKINSLWVDHLLNGTSNS